jgi:hypothetical protein
MLLSLLHPGELLEEVPSKRVAFPTNGTVGFTDQLGDDMKITHLREELRDLAKRLVRVHLLEVSLGQPTFVRQVALIGPIQ